MQSSNLRRIFIAGTALLFLVPASVVSKPETPEFELFTSIQSFGVIGSSGEVTVTVKLSPNAGGDPGRFKWTYTVTNNSYNPSPLANGFSGLLLCLDGSPNGNEWRDFESPSASWNLAVSVLDKPTWWNQFGTGIMPGQSGTFSFTSAARFEANTDGFYHSHVFGAGAFQVFFPSGGGPLGPGDLFGLPGGQPPTDGLAYFYRTIPPNPDTPGCNGQPPLDSDENGDGELDSWNIPMFLPKAGGGFWPTTDEMGNTLSIVGMPGQSNCTGGYFSARFQDSGGSPGGKEIGWCMYPRPETNGSFGCPQPMGRNSFFVDFEDKNGNGIPDRFTGSRWVTADNCTGERHLFKTDLTENCDVVAPVLVPSTLASERSGAVTYIIPDVVILDLNTDLSTVVVNGDTLGRPGGTGIPDSLVLATFGNIPTSRTTLDSLVQNGINLTVFGTLTNDDVLGHSYQFAMNAVGAIVDTLPPLAVNSGATEPFQISATLTNPSNPDTIAVVVYAYAETGNLKDDSFDAIIHRTDAVTAAPDYTPRASNLSVVPNPVAADAIISFSQSKPGVVDVEIFDVAGRLVRRLKPSKSSTGTHSLVWDGRNRTGVQVPSGVYFVRLSAGLSAVETRKIVVVR